MVRWLQRSTFPFLLLIVCLHLPAPARGQSFRVDTLARAPLSQYPVALAPVPGTQDFFFTEKNSGAIRIYERGVRPAPFGTLSVESEGEQGLLGIALHPGYPSTPYLYVFATRLIDRSNVVVRFRDSSRTGLDPTFMQIIPRTEDGSINNGGALAFGPDGKLYVGVGDYGYDPSGAQDLTTKRAYRGKILRLNPDGSTPADGPFPGRPYWSYGHRNPTGLSFDRLTGDLYSVEGGTSGLNGVYVVPRGGNLGWHAAAGGEGIVKPLYLFPPGAQPGLTSVLLYRGSAFPRLRGKLLFGGHANPTIWVGTLSASGDTIAVEPFFRSNAGFADIKEMPDGRIAFTNGPYISSRILELSPVGPEIISLPPVQAMEKREFAYRPIFTGTPPSVRLLEAPPGMTVDTSTWTIRWTPIWSRGAGEAAAVEFLAENGGGSVRQRFTLEVLNVNDPPAPFALVGPADGATWSVTGADPEATLRWRHSVDPDGDTLRYRVECDTVYTFASPALRDTLVEADSLHLIFPRQSATWYWRVTARDRSAITEAGEGIRRFSVTIIAPPAPPEPERLAVPEQPPPLPIGPTTSLQYTMQRSGHVHLSLFNLLGQEVVVLVDENQPAGAHEVGIGDVNLPSGVYFYRLQGPGIFETRKVVISR